MGLDTRDSIIRYCLYARKSMEAEERQALSIDSQIKEMQSVATRDGLNVVAIKTEAHSAKSSGERKVFNEMIAGLKNNAFDAILTWAPDRLSRNAGDLGRLVDLMDQGRLLEIRTYAQAFTNSPNDKFLLMILCSQAKLENDNRGINVRRGLKTRVEAGLWPCSDVPTGYKKSKLVHERAKAYIDRERAPIIKQMFEKVAYENYTTYDLYYWLREIGFKTHRGYPSISTVQTILHRPFYYGEFEFPKNSGKWYKGKHTPIISKKLFDQVQKKLSKHVSPPKKKRGSTTYTFNHMMRCGHCDSGITAQTKIKKLKTRNITYVYYSCSRGKDRRCKALYANEKDVMPQIARLLDQVDIDFVGMQKKLIKDLKLQEVLFGNGKKKSKAEQEKELRAYANFILAEGTIEEKRAILECLKNKIILTDKTVSVSPEILKENVQKNPPPTIQFSILTPHRNVPFKLLHTNTIRKGDVGAYEITGGARIILRNTAVSRRDESHWIHSFYVSDLQGVALPLFTDWLYEEIEGIAGTIKELKIGYRVVLVDKEEIRTAFEKSVMSARK